MADSYKEAIEYLYRQLPMFSRTGAAAYKPGLQTSIDLDAYFGSPHRAFRSIHVAGTNGKGSVSNMIAASLQAAGYKTGLYTSPHLVDFRERIRVDGRMIPKEAVVDFTRRFRSSGYEGHPSFFELTMMMAFDWFARCSVDYAVIEVGMGGRLDSTNIITPEVCVITNIELDHTQFLGSTRAAIAAEKAGIIKPGIPVVIGESDAEVRPIFEAKTREVGAHIFFAEDDRPLASCTRMGVAGGWKCESSDGLKFTSPLGGDYQPANIATALEAFRVMRSQGMDIPDSAVATGMSDVCRLTGFTGRWTVLQDKPLCIADTGHNPAGLSLNMERLRGLCAENGGTLRIVLGFVADKDVDHIMGLLPPDAAYYVTQADIPRAMDCRLLEGKLRDAGMRIEMCTPRVAEAYHAATAEAADSDVIYVGGSTFVVADLMASFDNLPSCADS